MLRQKNADFAMRNAVRNIWQHSKMAVGAKSFVINVLKMVLMNAWFAPIISLILVVELATCDTAEIVLELVGRLAMKLDCVIIVRIIVVGRITKTMTSNLSKK